MLRSVRAERRTTSARPAALLGGRLPLVAAAVVVAGMTAACGPSAEPVGSAASAGAQASPAARPAEAAATASAAVSATSSALPSASVAVSASVAASASVSASGSSPSPSRTGKGSGPGSGSGSGSGGATGTSSKPAPTTAAPGPARVPGPGYDSSADARAQIDAALRAAKSDGRMVLLDFGANWCGNCKAADKVFAQPRTSAILGESYHLVKIDIGGDSSANSALLRAYSPSGGTYRMPVLVVVSPSGTTRTDTHVTGNPPLTAEGIDSFLRAWAP
ncbi:thioredoxin family protein [Streptomyces sp. RerS4]|uniref:thioredoxin family protein n=1 Tax=Streptomyces sp. RerS4 TaxID=2942449 RepID=UPI00201C29BC|nr:thioredoxin family protein [Streptomyces sp. RerS4]UQX04508.1 thioredoxin family protein [Streptomyces sp. RerS4]